MHRSRKKGTFYFFAGSTGVTSKRDGARKSRMSPFFTRRGVSLLEVLVSVFILLFGLLALAAVLPVATLRIIQTGKADRSGACGAAGMRDVKIRRMVDPTTWRRWRVSLASPDYKFQSADIGDSSYTPPRRGIPFGFSFAIDPLGFAHNRTDGMETFPYQVPVGLPAMVRVTAEVPSYTNTISPPPPANRRDMPQWLAERIFMWRDDLNIPVPDEGGVRPRMVMLDDGGQENAFPALPGETVGSPLAAAVQGNYSWLVTVTPQVGDNPSVFTDDYFDTGNINLHYIDEHPVYSVSVVVFYNRDFSSPSSPLDPEKPGERMVGYVDVLGGGYGGGDVRLVTDSSTGTTAAYLDLKKGEWLMLCGNDGTRDVFRWYRVVAASETLNVDLNGNGAFDAGETDFLMNGNFDWFQEVTLAGPDWDAISMPNPTAALFTTVIGVYTTTIELDDGVAW